MTPPNLPNPAPGARRLWSAVLLACLGLAGGLLAAAAAGFTSLQPLLNALAADGSLESFTPAAYDRLRPALAAGGAGLLILGLLWLAGRRAILPALAAGLDALAPRRLLADGRALFAALAQTARRERAALAALGGITLLGLLLRAAFLARPMRYDEAYTVVAFAARPLWYAVSDYHLPNNHLFHTLLVHLALNTLGGAPWMVRLPAFLAGALAVPAVYLAARLLYDRPIALLSAVLVAASPELVDFSANARGYTLVGLFTLLLVASAAVIRSQPNRAAWLAFSLCAAGGLYAIPVMLYPLAGTAAWLLLSWAAGDLHPAYGRRFPFLLAAALVAAGLLAGLAYTPVLLNTGLDSLVGNPFVAPLPWPRFLESLPVRFVNTWEEWTLGLPPFASLLWAIGMLAGLGLHRRLAAQRIPLALALLLAVAILLPIQRVAPIPKVWSIVLPLALTWAAAGLLGLLRLLPLRPALPERLSAGLALALAAGLCLYSLNEQPTGFTEHAGPVGDAQAIAAALPGLLQDGDIVIVPAPVSAPVWFYTRLEGLPDAAFPRAVPQAGFARLLLIVPEGDATAQVLEKERLTRLVDPASAALLEAFPSSSLVALAPAAP
jgi:hypothetical protein